MYHVEIADYLNFADEERLANFAKFVEDIVQFAHKLTSLSLKCFLRYDVSRVTRWIDDIFRRENIGSLEISFLSSPGNKEPIVLPWSLLDRSSFKTLQLRLPGFTFNLVGPKNSFFNLTSFHLHVVQILNGNRQSDTLVLDFPVLKIFEVIRCKWVDVKFLKIYASVLDTFISCMGSPEIGTHLIETFESVGEDSLCIEIIGSRLSTYRSSGDKLDKMILTGSQIVSTSFENEFHIHSPLELTRVGLDVRKLLNETSRLNELELSNFMVRALRSGSPLRKHDEMKRLLLKCPGNTKQLFELLHVAPSLSCLTVNVHRWDNYNYGKRSQLLPCCIVSHLEEVHLIGFAGKPSQYNFAKCLLKNGQVLKKIIISGCHPDQQDIITSKISIIPRISTTLTIAFFGLRASTVVVDKSDQLQL